MITRYVIVDTESGEIVRTVVCDAASADAQAQTGEVCIEHASAQRATHYYDGTGIGAYTQEQANAKAARPAHAAQWSNATLSWTDTRTLAEARAQAWERIKAEREQRAAQAGHAVTPALDSSEADRANITSVAVMLMAAPAIPSVRFTCADNERRTIARADFLAAALTIGGAVQALFEVADNLRAEIEAAATVAEVDAIEWP